MKYSAPTICLCVLMIALTNITSAGQQKSRNSQTRANSNDSTIAYRDARSD